MDQNKNSIAKNITKCDSYIKTMKNDENDENPNKEHYGKFGKHNLSKFYEECDEEEFDNE